MDKQSNFFKKSKDLKLKKPLIPKFNETSKRSRSPILKHKPLKSRSHSKTISKKFTKKDSTISKYTRNYQKKAMYSTRDIGIRSRTPNKKRFKTPNLGVSSRINTRESKLRKISESKVCFVKEKEKSSNLLLQNTCNDFRLEKHGSNNTSDLFQK